MNPILSRVRVAIATRGVDDYHPIGVKREKLFSGDCGSDAAVGVDTREFTRYQCVEVFRHGALVDYKR